MGDVSKIEWLRGGHTASPWHGCSHVHTGCTNCYAETMAKRNPGVLGVWGGAPFGTRVRSKSFGSNCDKWQKQAAAAGVRSCVFPSICDPFEDWGGAVLDSKGQVLHRGEKWGSPGCYVTPGFFIGKSAARLSDLRADMFATIDRCPDLDFLLLTKRPENIRKMWPRAGFPNAGVPGTLGMYLRLSNVNLIYSASDQATLDAGMPDLLACRDLCPVLGLSLEPLVGPIDLSRYLPPTPRSECPAEMLPHYNTLWNLDWVIVGGESGPNARPCNPEWVRSIRDQCVAAGVPFFFKQWGEWMPTFHGIDPNKGDPNCRIKAFHSFGDQNLWKVGKAAAGRLLDGREWNEFPTPTPAEAAA